LLLLGNKLIELDKNNPMNEKAVLELTDLTKEMVFKKDLENFKLYCKKANLPQWMIDRTYFESTSYHIYYTTDSFVFENCTIKWVLFGPSGVSVPFEFNYSCEGNATSCEPSASVIFRRYEGTLINIDSLSNNNQNEEIARKNYLQLINLLGITEEEVTPNMVFQYVTCCSMFRERVIDETITDRKFYFNLHSTKYCHFWPSIYYAK